MILPSLILLASLASGGPAAADPARSIERIVVVLGERDRVTSSRVLRQLKSCTERIPTAVVAAFRELQIEQDFNAASPESGESSFSLASQLSLEKAGGARSLAASLQLLGEALAPVGPTTAIVLVSPHIGADPGIGLTSPDQPHVDGAQSAPVDYYSTVTIPDSVIEARKALSKAGLTLVAVNTRRTYDAAVKALTEIPKGRYLQYSQRNFSKAFSSAVCAPGR